MVVVYIAELSVTRCIHGFFAHMGQVYMLFSSMSLVCPFTCV